MFQELPGTRIPIEKFLDGATRGERAGNGFKREPYAAVTLGLEESQSNLPIDPEMIFPDGILPPGSSVTQDQDLQKRLRDSQTPFHSHIHRGSTHQTKRQRRVKKRTGKAIADAPVDMKNTALTMRRESGDGTGKADGIAEGIWKSA